MPKRHWPIALPVGFLLATATVVVIYMFGGGNGVGLLMYFGVPSAYLIDAITPTQFWYWAFPEGGGPAAVALFGVAAWLQLWVIVSLIAYWFIAAKKKNRKLT